MHTDANQHSSIFELNALLPILFLYLLYEIAVAMFCSKAVNNAVDLFKYFGSKGSVIRYSFSFKKTLLS